MGRFTDAARKYADHDAGEPTGQNLSLALRAMERVASLYPPGLMARLSQDQLKEIERATATLEESMTFGDEWSIGVATRHWERLWWRLLGIGAVIKKGKGKDVLQKTA